MTLPTDLLSKLISNHAQIRTTVAGGQASGECLILQNKNDATAYILLDSEL